MCDVLILAPGGGWATDTTGSPARCLQRVRDLAASTRGRKQITRIIDRRTGATIWYRDR